MSKEKLAKFGKLCLDYFKRCPDFHGDEISTDIIPLAEQCGLIEKVEFDPEIHNDTSGCCEPGDDFWIWKEEE